MHPLPLDSLNLALRDQYFHSDSNRRSFSDDITITTADGHPLLHLWQWSATPNRPQPSTKDDPGCLPGLGSFFIAR